MTFGLTVGYTNNLNGSSKYFATSSRHLHRTPTPLRFGDFVRPVQCRCVLAGAPALIALLRCRRRRSTEIATFMRWLEWNLRVKFSVETIEIIQNRHIIHHAEFLMN